MKQPEHYLDDLLYFSTAGRSNSSCTAGCMLYWTRRSCPELSVKVQKSQVSFYGRHLFAAASLPLRRKKDWPKHCLIVTVGLGRRLESPRVAVAVEPYPGRWTHHVLVSEAGELDGELLSWLREAYEFSELKR